MGSLVSIIFGKPDRQAVALEQNYERETRNFDSEFNVVKSALTHRGAKGPRDLTQEATKLDTIATNLNQTGQLAKEEEKAYQGKFFSEKSGKRIKYILVFCSAVAAIAALAYTIWNALADSHITVDNPALNCTNPNPPKTLTYRVKQPWGPAAFNATIAGFLLLLFLANQIYESNKKSIKKLKKIDQDEINRRKTITDTLSAVEALKNVQSSNVNTQLDRCCFLIANVSPNNPSVITIEPSDLIYRMANNLPQEHEIARHYRIAAGEETVLKEKGRKASASKVTSKEDDGKKPPALVPLERIDKSTNARPEAAKGSKRGSLVLQEADGGARLESAAAASMFNVKPLDAQDAHYESARFAEPLEESIPEDPEELKGEVERLRALILLEEKTGMKINKLYNSRGAIGRDFRPIPETDHLTGSQIGRQVMSMAGAVAPPPTVIDLSQSPKKDKQPEKQIEEV